MAGRGRTTGLSRGFGVDHRLRNAPEKRSEEKIDFQVGRLSIQKKVDTVSYNAPGPGGRTKAEMPLFEREGQ